MICVDDKQFIKNQEESFFNNIQGIFIFLDSEKKTFKLSGNNKDILGIDKSEIILSISEIEEFIDAKYKEIFKSLLNNRELEKVSVEIRIKNIKNESKVILVQGKRFLKEENIYIYSKGIYPKLI